jgi:alpha-tubulin suppressor-like RCC1 family protein
MLIALAAVAPALARAAPGPSAGQLYAFGENFGGQLGNATSEGTLQPNPTPTPVTQPGVGAQVTQVAGGEGFSLAATAAGQLYAFGFNTFGQLGNSTDNGMYVPNATAALVALPGPVTQVAGGGSHSLALTSTGQLYAFGANFSGQLGNPTNQGTEEANPTPSLVTLPGATGPATQVAAGGEQSLVVTSSGQLYAFGNNYNGQLGNTTNTGKSLPNATPTQVTLLGASGPVTQVAAGAFYSLALTSAGQLYAFGDNVSGQLGRTTNNGNHNANPTPEQVSLPGASGPVTQIAAGYEHSLALTSSGQLYAFGDNQYGQLGSLVNSGSGAPNPTPSPVTLPGARGMIVQISAGYFQSLALTASGQLYAFGDNQYGALGNTTNLGSEAPNATPTQVGLSSAATIITLARGSLATHSLVAIAPLGVTATSLPAGAVGVPYVAQAQAGGGVVPYSWSASNLPPGLSIDRQSGVISGTPSAAGSYPAMLTVTDSSGIEASALLLIPVNPLPSAIQALPAPRISGARQSASRWREGGKLAHISRHKTRLPVGSTFSFSLNEQASVSFAFTQQVSGRKVGRRCVTKTRMNARRKGCTRTVTAGTLSFTAHGGINRVVFQGHISRSKWLAPGRYTLVITARNAAAQESTPVTLSFTIVR